MSGLFSLAIGVALKSSALLGGVWCVARMMRRFSASMRHLLWSGSAVAVIAMPLLVAWLPVLRVPVPESTGVVFSAASSASPVVEITRSADAPHQANAISTAGGAFDWRITV